MIRIGIVDDHAIVRRGLKDYFQSHVDFRVAGEASTGREAMEMVRRKEVDVLVMDISMPDQNGIDALTAIKAREPDFPILILSGLPEHHYATAMLKKGANGYLAKDCDPEEIAKAIRVVVRGRKYISAAVAEQLAEKINAPAEQLPHEGLSEREFQVFVKLAQGLSVTDIADQLALSIKTISTYRSRLMEKMGLATNNDLTYYALKNGLIQ